MKAPAYQTYPKDFLSDLRCIALTNAQFGMYRKLLDHCWLEDGLPNEPAVLARAVGEPVATFCRKHWPVLEAFFFARVDGRLSQKRMEEVRSTHRQYSARQAEAARAKWQRNGHATASATASATAQPSDASGICRDDALQSPVSSLQSPVSREGTPVPSPAGVSLRSTPASPSRGRRGQARAVEPAKTDAAWHAYAEAYADAYGKSPTRNADVNRDLARLIARIGAVEAPDVAAFYVRHEGRWYVEKGHSTRWLAEDAQKLHTEWATGRIITATAARQADQTATNRETLQLLLADRAIREAKKPP